VTGRDRRAVRARGLLRVGIDVGGTNTDAVLMESDVVVDAVKTPTTADVTAGIVTALDELTGRRPEQTAQIRTVMIGTTHFMNAIVEAKGLSRIGVIRLGLPATAAIPPFVDWPDHLRAPVEGPVHLCHGGHEFDGRILSEPREEELVAAARDFERGGIRSVAIVSVFSPLTDAHEALAAEIVERVLPDASVSRSHDIGTLGLLERENATLMNASLRDVADRTVEAFVDAVAAAGIDAPVFLSQNDGTLMTSDTARRYPVATFASGPTNSMRGAAFLSGIKDCAVIDIGGTTSDIGILHDGFPRLAGVVLDVAGIRTNFRMPDVISIGLGGGSEVRLDPVEVGPASVGAHVLTEALIGGGETLTATDIAVAAGRASIGDTTRVAGLARDDVAKVLEHIESTLADTLDRMKTTADPIPVVVVGGGSILLDEALAGASELRRPPHFAVANAVGAAIAQVGATVERTVSLARTSRAEAISAATREAIERAVRAGANRETVQPVAVEDHAVPYTDTAAIRVRVQAVGDLEVEEANVALG
jgi:N-methylhydantoinase A/oxoprolinase/acetone carboxylase beta subunit